MLYESLETPCSKPFPGPPSKLDSKPSCPELHLLRKPNELEEIVAKHAYILGSVVIFSRRSALYCAAIRIMGATRRICAGVRLKLVTPVIATDLAYAAGDFSTTVAFVWARHTSAVVYWGGSGGGLLELQFWDLVR